MKLTPEELEIYEDVWEEVLDVLLGLTPEHPKYRSICESFKGRYEHDPNKFKEINYWIKARLFNKIYNEKYEETN